MLRDDSGLQEKLNAAADVDAVVAIAKEVGFMISAEAAEELQRSQAEISEDELTEDELAGVAGGFGSDIARGQGSETISWYYPAKEKKSWEI